MFKAWRAKRLITKLTGLKVRRDELKKIMNQNETVPAWCVNEYLDLCQEVAELEFKIEMLKDEK